MSKNYITNIENGPIPCDTYGAPISIDFDQYLIHEGVAFLFSNCQASKASFSWSVRTPNTGVRCHAVLSLEVAAPGYLQLWSNPSFSTTVTGTWATLTALNMDQNSSGVAVLVGTAGHWATGSGGHGTLLLTKHVTDAAGGIVSTGAVRGKWEFVLQQNTPYAISWTSETAATVIFNAEWYEVGEA